MSDTFIEENGAYCINCQEAVWATNKMHEDYHKAGIHIQDVDFIIESEEFLFLVEYKNANIRNAERPEAFQPESDKKISIAARKFFDSLHYLKLLNKTKPVQYIYVLEYPNGDRVSRQRLRNRLKTELPFALQQNTGEGIRLIDKVEVLSVEEWNKDTQYGKYPILPVDGEK